MPKKIKPFLKKTSTNIIFYNIIVFLKKGLKVAALLLTYIAQ